MNGIKQIAVANFVEPTEEHTLLASGLNSSHSYLSDHEGFTMNALNKIYASITLVRCTTLARISC